jgi:hypothetical protein
MRLIGLAVVIAVSLTLAVFEKVGVFTDSGCGRIAWRRGLAKGEPCRSFLFTV